MSTKLTRTLGLGAIKLSWPTFLVITLQSPLLLLLVSQPLECPRTQSTRTPSPPTLIPSLVSSKLVASDTNCMLTASSSRTDQDCPLNPRYTSTVHFDIFANTSTEHGQPHSVHSHGIPGLWDKCASPGAQAEGSGPSHGSNALSLLPSTTSSAPYHAHKHTSYPVRWQTLVGPPSEYLQNPVALLQNPQQAP